MFNSKHSGFSMIEMMMVVVILGIMTAGVTLSIHKMSNTYNKYTSVVVLHDLVTLQQGIELYQRIYGVSPTNIEEMMSGMILTGDPSISTGEFFVGFDKDNNPIAMYKNSLGQEFDASKYAADL